MSTANQPNDFTSLREIISASEILAELSRGPTSVPVLTSMGAPSTREQAPLHAVPPTTRETRGDFLTAASRPGPALDPASPAETTGIAPLCRDCDQRKQRVLSSDGRRALWACPCQDARIVREDHVRAARDAAARQAAAERMMGDTGLRLVEHFVWEALDRTKPGFDAQALDTVHAWFTAALAYGPHGDYHQGPPPALFLHSAGKGRGKTHIAAGAFNAARQAHKLAVFVEEHSYLRRRWSCDFEALDQVVGLPGDRAWLTVLDDLGQRGKTSEAVADVWYEVINPRWLKRGWTIITSNWLPEELWSRGTINDATYSRLRQMTRGEIVTVHGPDQRLVLPGGAA